MAELIEIDQVNYKMMVELCSENADIEQVKHLILSGANVNAKNFNDNDNTLLMMALSNDNLLLAEILVKAGADVNLPNNLTRSPIFDASREGNLDAVNFLIEHGADLEFKNRQGHTSLISAILNSEIEVAKLLINANANIEVCGSKDNPLLIMALYSHLDLKVIQLLVEGGADLNARDNQGNSISEIISGDYLKDNTMNGSYETAVNYLQACIENKAILDSLNKESAADQPVKPSKVFRI